MNHSPPRTIGSFIKSKLDASKGEYNVCWGKTRIENSKTVYEVDEWFNSSSDARDFYKNGIRETGNPLKVRVFDEYGHCLKTRGQLEGWSDN